MQVLFWLAWLVPTLWSAREYSRFSGKHDDQRIVVDEIIGVWIPLMVIPQDFPGNWIWIVVAFLFFRLFDILKPFPSDHADRNWPGCFGVVFDDVFAGVYALIVIRLLQHLEPLL